MAAAGLALRGGRGARGDLNTLAVGCIIPGFGERASSVVFNTTSLPQNRGAFLYRVIHACVYP